MFLFLIDHSNYVCLLKEFTDILLKTRRDSTDDIEELKEAFKVFDLDGDGIITVKILLNLIFKVEQLNSFLL